MGLGDDHGRPVRTGRLRAIASRAALDGAPALGDPSAPPDDDPAVPSDPVDPLPSRRALSREREARASWGSVARRTTEAGPHPVARRWALRPRPALLCAAVVLVGGLGGAALALADTPRATRPLPELSPSAVATAGVVDPESGSPSAGAADPADPSVEDGSPGGEPWLQVHVAGQVREPGVLSLPPGSRVIDAVDRAGGLAEDAEPGAVNLARPLSDGEQVYIPRAGEPMPAGAGDTAPVLGSGAGRTDAGGGTGGTVVDLNRATVEQLDALPGIGPVLAGRILDWRAAHGRFSTVQQLQEVSGVGPALLGRLDGLVRV